MGVAQIWRGLDAIGRALQYAFFSRRRSQLKGLIRRAALFATSPPCSVLTSFHAWSFAAHIGDVALRKAAEVPLLKDERSLEALSALPERDCLYSGETNKLVSSRSTRALPSLTFCQIAGWSRRRQLVANFFPLLSNDLTTRLLHHGHSGPLSERESRELGRAKALAAWIKFIGLTTPQTWERQAEEVSKTVEGCTTCQAAVEESLEKLKAKFDGLPEVFAA